MGTMRMNQKAKCIFCNKSNERENLCVLYHQMDFIPRINRSPAVSFSSLAQMYMYRHAFQDPVHLAAEHHRDLQTLLRTPSYVQPFFLFSDYPHMEDQTERDGCQYVKWLLSVVGLVFFQSKTILKMYTWKVEMQLEDNKKV